MNKGFSLVELILVMAVLTIIIGIVIVTYPKVIRNSRLKTDRVSAAYIAKGLRGWYTDSLSDNQLKGEFKAFIEEKLYNKTLKLSELSVAGLDAFVDSKYRPYSLLDTDGHEVANQGFYVGIIGDGINSKFIITVETEDERLGEISEEVTANYDGTSIGVIYIED